MAMPKTALEGIRVIDLGRYQAGPRIGLVLARLGAEVIKVEAPEAVEPEYGALVRGQSATGCNITAARSLGLDLRTAGQRGAGRLVKVSSSSFKFSSRHD